MPSKKYVDLHKTQTGKKLVIIAHHGKYWRVKTNRAYLIIACEQGGSEKHLTNNGRRCNANTRVTGLNVLS